MATLPLVCTIGTSDANGSPISPAVRGAAAQGSLPSTTAVADAVAVLEADGATPTEAHVDDLATAWTAYLAALATYSAASVSGNAVLSLDTAVVTDKNKVRAVLRAFMQAVDSGQGGLS